MNINLRLDGRLPLRLLILLAAPIYLIIFLAGTANASNYWSGSTPDGNGSGDCSFDSAWYTGNQWSDIRLFHNGCNGTLMNPGHTIPAGNPCAAKGDVAQVFWLGERPAGGSWIYYYDGTNDDQANWRAAVAAKAYNVKIKNAAFKQTGEKTLVWVCNDDVITEATPEKPTTACRSGINTLIIPSPSTGTRYMSGGKNVNGDTPSLESGAYAGAFSIRQELTSTDYEWPDGTRADKVWTRGDFTMRDCIININVTIVHCDATGEKNSGYFRVNFVGNDQNDVNMAVARDPGGNIGNVVEGNNYAANDSVTLTFKPDKEESGAGKRVVTNLNGSQVANNFSRTMKSCNNSISLSVRFVPVLPVRSSVCNPSTNLWENRVTPGSWAINVNPPARASWVSRSPGSSGTNIAVGATVSPHAYINGNAAAGTKFGDAGGALGKRNAASTDITWGNNAANTVYTFGYTGAWTKTAGTACAQVTGGGRQTDTQNTFVRTDCTPGSYQTTNTSLNTRGPYAYAWTTLISNGGPSVGGSTIQTQSAIKYTPLGLLLQAASQNNQEPSQAAIDAAIAQAATTDHSRLDLNEANKAAFAKGGVMNVQELTTRVNLIITRTDVYDNYYDDCVDVYASQASYRDITYTEVLRWTRETRTQYATWEARFVYPGELQKRTRTRNTGTHCSNDPGSYPGTTGPHPRSGEVGHTDNGSSCTAAGVTRNQFTWWGSWGSWSAWASAANCNAGVGAGYATDTDCRTTSTTYSVWFSGGGTSHTSCPGPGAGYEIRNCVTNNYTAWANATTVEACTPGTLVNCTPTTSAWNYTCGPGNRGSVVSVATRSTHYGTLPSATTGQGIPANVCWTQWQDTGYYNTNYRRIPTGSALAYTSYTTDVEEQTPEVTSFWQALANHCNSAGYNSALTARAGNLQIANNDSTENYSGSAVTANMSNTNSPVWGAGATGAGAATNDVGFFDKQCSYNGVKASSAKQPPASALGDNWTYFRDNAQHDLGVYLFEPASGGVVTYNDTQALRTLATRWAEGTPKPYGVEAGELFLRTDDGQDVWQASDSTPFVLKNWSTTESGAATTWGLVQGQQTVFKVAADWPSDTARPNVFQVKWEYDPNVANTVPLTQVGFGIGGVRAYTSGVVSTPIQGWVMGAATGNTTPAIDATKQANSSGSSAASNTIDGNLISGVAVDAQNKWTQDPNSFSTYYYWLKFVRSTGE